MYTAWALLIEKSMGFFFNKKCKVGHHRFCRNSEFIGVT